MKIVLLSVAIVMQLQIRRRDMTGAFDMDPIAAVLHFNVLKSNIITAGFFTGGRVSAAVKKETNLIIPQILTVRPLVNGADQFHILYRDVAGDSGIEQRRINGAPHRRTPDDNRTRPRALKCHIATQQQAAVLKPGTFTEQYRAATGDLLNAFRQFL